MALAMFFSVFQIKSFAHRINCPRYKPVNFPPQPPVFLKEKSQAKKCEQLSLDEL